MARYLKDPAALDGPAGSLQVWGLPVAQITGVQRQQGKDPITGEVVPGVQVAFTYPLLEPMAVWVPWTRYDPSSIYFEVTNHLRSELARVGASMVPRRRAEQRPTDRQLAAARKG